MTINASTGVINWTPAATGTFDVTVRADNSEGFDEKSFTITVAIAPEAPVIDPIANQTATADSLFTYTASATGNPTPTFSLVKPPTPADMTINASTGVINWTPAATGTFDVTVRATNSAGSDDESFTINVTQDFELFLPLILNN